MLSVEKCRELISGNEKYTDKDIEEIRATLYGLAELALERYFEDKVNTSALPPRKTAEII